MKDKFAVSMFGQKRLSREGGIEIVVKELCRNPNPILWRCVGREHSGREV